MTASPHAPRPAVPPEPALEARELVFGYGSRAVLSGLSLRFAAGELTAIVGPNGCGKSTLLHVLLGHLAPQRGSVTVTDSAGHGTHVHTLRAARRARLLAFVPQTGSVGFAYTARQIVLMARWARHAQRGLDTALGFETLDDQRIADAALATMDAAELADRPVTALSGGERQRVIIARALAQETSILLLDEPTSAFDLYHQLMLLEHLRTLAHARRKLVVLVTHDLNLARQFADRVIVMAAGRVGADGPPGTVLVPGVLEPVYHVRVAAGESGVLSFHR